VTTTEGEFVLDGLEAGTYFVRAIGARDKPEQIKNLYLAAGEERWVEIVMTRGLAISGRVIEEKGEPIEGATVETTPAFDQQGSMVYGIAGEVDNWAREALRVKTAADGTFRLDRLASGNHRIVVRHPEWAIAVLPKIAASSEDVTIVMARGGSVRGRVLDATGSSLGDAQVALDLCADSLISGRMWRRRYETTTDAEGRFAFSNASVGRSMLEARTDGLPERVLEVDVPDADAPPLELEIRLGASATLRGRVVDADGGVVAEARIWAESTEGILLRRQVDSGDDGTFRVEELERGLEYRLDIRDDRYMRAEPLIIWALKAETDLGDVQLEPGLAIYGRVILAAGDPVSNARVGLERLAGAKNDGSESWGGAGGTTFCDADGRFMLGGLEAGTFRAIVRADGIGIARSERVVLIEGTEAPELRIGMGGGPQVAGQVVDERGFPVAGSRVVIGEYSPRDVAAWSDREGRFRFAHVDLPVIWIRAQLDTFESEALAVVPGETVELVLARMAAIAGVVRDAVSGAPLREFEVHLDRSRGPDYGSGEIFVQPAGQFNLTDVPPGDYILSVHAHGYLGFEADLTLVAAERREIEIPMRPALQLRGRVLDIDGSLLVNAQVTGHIDGEEAPSRVPRGTMMAFDRWGRKIAIMFQGRRADSAVTDRRGEFVLDVPADCELTVLVHTADHLDARLGPLRVADRTLDVGEIRVERGAGCIGTVFLPDGKPRGGGSIRICPVDHQHGARSRYKAIGPDGSFRFSGLEPGRYGIEVFGAEETRKEVELDAAEIAPLELRLGPEHRR
ncbi:MAG: carboxypeptidase regulatory-like domain-containing protein, partial [Planctomycetes bacterium]|nr:carboxypeptidase regulatory-like domain-containing protein [Planctomycetota bacterium]